MAEYRYLAHDVRTNVPIGVLPLGQVRYTERLNAAPTLDATIDLAARSSTGRRLASEFTAATIPGRSKITVVRNQLAMCDSFIVLPRSKRDRPLQIRGAGTWSATTEPLTVNVGPFTAVDQFTIARTLLQSVMSGPADLGWQYTADLSGRLRDRDASWYRGFEMRPVGQLVADLAGLIDGFDFAVTVAIVDETPTSTFRMFYPRRGRSFAESSLTFTLSQGATKGNLLGYALDEGAPVTTVWLAGAGEGESMLRRVATRTDLLDAGWPRITETDTTTHKDVTDPATLQSHAEAMLRRLNARASTWTIQVDPDTDSMPLGTWEVGDDCKVVIPDDERFPGHLDDGGMWVNGYEGLHRIVGQTVTVGDDGHETVELELEATGV